MGAAALNTAPVASFTTSIRSSSTGTSKATFLPTLATRQLPNSSALFVSSDVEVGKGSVPIVVTGTNIDVTEALKDHVTKKMERVVGKLASSGLIRECDVHLTVTRNPEVKNAHEAEVTTYLKGTTIRSTMATPDMYGSIDLVASKLARKLAKYKDRRIKGYHGGANMGQQLAEILDEITVESSSGGMVGDDEAFSAEADQYVMAMTDDEPSVTRIKSYDLSKPQSLKEAIFALDYIDHDFYVFRDAATDLISVVYKRNAGGIGLIQPQQ